MNNSANRDSFYYVPGFIPIHSNLLQWKLLDRDASGVSTLSRISEIISIVIYEFLQKMCSNQADFPFSRLLIKLLPLNHFG